MLLIFRLYKNSKMQHCCKNILDFLQQNADNLVLVVLKMVCQRL